MIEYKLAEQVKGNVNFVYYRDSTLYYKTDAGLLFPVPISDTGTGTFKTQDKALYFMRWIRKTIDALEKELE